jgi:beta-lactamase superfamily II metal-dependent hydrolase
MPLTTHFLNVGHGDCTLIEHPSGRITMIDINNSKSLPEPDIDALAEDLGLTASAFRAGGSPPAGFKSWEEYYRSFLVDPVDYFRETFGGDATVFRYIQTHPDMDHMSGLFRFFRQEEIDVQNMWDIEHTKDLDSDSFTSSPYDELDWLVYKLMRSGMVKQGAEHKVIHPLRGDERQYWADDDIRILGPTQDLIDYANETENWNNLSYVLRLEHAGRSIILPGDAEKPAWDKIESFDETEDLPCDILKASHHGRESGYSESATDAMSPDYVICSVGKKPSTDASDEYASHGAKVLSTRYHGTITVTIEDDGAVQIADRNGTSIGSLPSLSQKVA